MKKITQNQINQLVKYALLIGDYENDKNFRDDLITEVSLWIDREIFEFSELTQDEFNSTVLHEMQSKKCKVVAVQQQKENKMAENNTIFQALVKAQSEMTNPKKNTDNSFLDSKYADLAECWKACSEALKNNDLAVIQTVVEDRLVTRLIHASGQDLKDGGVPLLGYTNSKNPAQALGASITYARRYGLCSMLGLSPDKDDDDGNKLRQDTKKEDTITQDQQDYIKKLISDAKRDQVKFLKECGVNKFSEITVEDYNTWKNFLEEKFGIKK
jgi:uncharacterized protein (DUF2147 family)